MQAFGHPISRAARMALIVLLYTNSIILYK